MNMLGRASRKLEKAAFISGILSGVATKNSGFVGKNENRPESRSARTVAVKGRIVF